MMMMCCHGSSSSSSSTLTSTSTSISTLALTLPFILLLTACSALPTVSAFQVSRSNIPRPFTGVVVTRTRTHIPAPTRIPTPTSVLALAATDTDTSDNNGTGDSISSMNTRTRAVSASASVSVVGRKNELDLDLPWGDRQEWALMDNIGKYLVTIPTFEGEVGGSGGSGSGDGGNEYAMWRSLTRDVIELTGYDAEILRQKYVESKMKNDKDTDTDSDIDDDTDDDTDSEIGAAKATATAPGLLPLLDQFEFQSNGGVSGQIQGLKGIADGTTVQTSPLVHVQLTVPRGYVLTEDGSSAYELGVPVSEDEDFYSLDNIAKMNMNMNMNMGKNIQDMDAGDMAGVVKAGVEGTGKLAGNMASAAITSAGDEETTRMLVNLGATTGILLGGAMAVNLLSHHLTVNMFWV